ncbi:MAG: hypothetical protein IIA45_02010 [Bacteroidetes bacterium]|nr:hypothetical protein [Bacteroidota bacterium]
MPKNIRIEWSETFDNDILDLARSENTYLDLPQGIYMYVCNGPEQTGRIGKPLFISCLSGNHFVSNIREQLIQNIGRYQLREMIHDHCGNSAGVMVGRVVKNNKEEVTASELQTLCKYLVGELNPPNNQLEEDIREVPVVKYHVDHMYQKRSRAKVVA